MQHEERSRDPRLICRQSRQSPALQPLHLRAVLGSALAQFSSKTLSLYWIISLHCCWRETHTHKQDPSKKKKNLEQQIESTWQPKTRMLFPFAHDQILHSMCAHTQTHTVLASSTFMAQVVAIVYRSHLCTSSTGQRTIISVISYTHLLYNSWALKQTTERKADGFMRC